MTEPIAPEELERKIENGLMPELSDKFVQVGNKKLHITEMPVLYVKMLNRKMKPFYAFLTGMEQVDVSKLVSVEAIENMYDNLLELAEIVTTRIDPTVDKAYLEATCSEKKLIEIIQAQLEVNGLVNFLKDISKGLIQMLASVQMSKMNT